MESLRAMGAWAADCAERALQIYERQPDADRRPREAIEAIRTFASGFKRSAQLRVLSLAALAAARDTANPAASAAARAACLAASIAYTHPFADLDQAKHILGPPAYAALALELDHPSDPRIAATEISWAIGHATPPVRDVLRQMPSRTPGTTRLDELMYELDRGLRGV